MCAQRNFGHKKFAQSKTATTWRRCLCVYLGRVIADIAAKRSSTFVHRHDVSIERALDRERLVAAVANKRPHLFVHGVDMPLQMLFRRRRVVALVARMIAALLVHRAHVHVEAVAPRESRATQRANMWSLQVGHHFANFFCCGKRSRSSRYAQHEIPRSSPTLNIAHNASRCIFPCRVRSELQSISHSPIDRSLASLTPKEKK